MRLISIAKILLYIVLILVIASSVDAAAFLTGQTPASYNLPSGWSLVRTSDFESGCPSGEDCGLWDGSITTTKPHNGTVGVHHSIEGTYSADQAFPGWRLSEFIIGSYTQLYISWYEWLSTDARFNDEFWMFHIVTPSGSEPWEEIVIPWFEGYNDSNDMIYNGTRSNLTIVTQGDIDSRSWLKTDNPATGTWVQWEIHLIPTAGTNAGSLYIYRNGSLYASKTNYTLTTGANFNNAQITIGGQYSQGCWFDISSETCSLTIPDDCSSGPGIGLNMGICWEGSGSCGSFSSPRCYPVQPAHSNFKRYFDDIIVMKLPGSEGGPDVQPPYITNQYPAAGATGVPTTQRIISMNIRDDRTDDDGIVQNTISLTIEGNPYTCAAGLSCTGSASNYYVTRTMGADWTDNQVVNITATATDAAGNVMNQVWSFTAATTPSTLNITTTTLPAGIVGTGYDQQLVSTGGTTPVTYSLDAIPYDPGGPYAPSTDIVGLTWDYANVITAAPGTDLWPMTWAANGNLYAVGGDGGGFNGTNNTCRARTTLANITGTPPSITGTNISGCMADDTGCDSWNLYHDASCDAPYAASATNEVPGSILAIGNTLYTTGWTFTSPPRSTMRTSSDLGHTWSAPSGMYWEYTTGQPFFTSFVNVNAGHSLQTYVYMTGLKPGTVGQYLARVPVASITNMAAYEYFSGTALSPAWSSTWADATQIFSDSNGNMNSMNISYFPVLGKYIGTVLHGVASDDVTDTPIQSLGVFEAPNPWGPWKTVYYSDSWGNYGTKHGLNNTISTKWLSSDNKTFYMVFSGPDHDSFNLIKGTFTLAAATQSLPGGLSLSSTGRISGIPTPPPASGANPVTTYFTVTATDSSPSPQTDNQALSITVNPATPSGQTTVTGTAIEDTWVITGTSANYSTDTKNRTYDWPDFTISNKIILMDNTDILGLPDNVSITAATLRLYLTDGGGYNPTDLTVHNITGTLPTISTVTGSNFSGTVGATLSTVAATLTPGWIDFNVLAPVQAAYAASAPVYLLVQGGTGTADTWRDFASAQHGTTSWKPQLVITYMQLVGPPGPSISAPGKMRVVKMKGGFK